MKINILGLVVLLLCTSTVFAKEEVVFTGIPSMKISEGGSFRTPAKISGAKSIENKCTITMLDDKYYWATRENVELVALSGGGAFITFLAMNGSGYVRIIKPGMKEIAALMDVTEEEYDYVEHLLIGLKSVTYYGKSK